MRVCATSSTQLTCLVYKHTPMRKKYYHTLLMWGEIALSQYTIYMTIYATGLILTLSNWHNINKFSDRWLFGVAAFKIKKIKKKNSATTPKSDQLPSFTPFTTQSHPALHDTSCGKSTQATPFHQKTQELVLVELVSHEITSLLFHHPRATLQPHHDVTSWCVAWVHPRSCSTTMFYTCY